MDVGRTKYYHAVTGLIFKRIRTGGFEMHFLTTKRTSVSQFFIYSKACIINGIEYLKKWFREDVLILWSFVRLECTKPSPKIFVFGYVTLITMCLQIFKAGGRFGASPCSGPVTGHLRRRGLGQTDKNRGHRVFGSIRIKLFYLNVWKCPLSINRLDVITNS